MKKIKKFSEFIVIEEIIVDEKKLNEELNFKSLIPAIMIATTLNLSSCKTKEDVKEKLPEIEMVIMNQIKTVDEKVYKHKQLKLAGPYDGIEYKKIISIDGPFKKFSNSPSIYYIVVNVNETIRGKKYNGFFIDIYKEYENGKGELSGSYSSISTSVKYTVPNIDEAKRQIEYHKEHDRWDVFNNFADYMDGLYIVKISLENMKNEYSGRYNELGLSSDIYNKPSDYYREIDIQLTDLNNIKKDSQKDLESNNINKREYEIITKQVNDLISQLEDFKYTIR